MSETIDYKLLYESIKMENEKLINKNKELVKELETYKMRYNKRGSYEKDIELIIEQQRLEKNLKRKEKIFDLF